MKILCGRVQIHLNNLNTILIFCHILSTVNQNFVHAPLFCILTFHSLFAFV